jgi:Zn-dependent protease
MILTQPQPTPLDLVFRLWGIPVRVSGWFWPVTALFGWGLCQALARDPREALQLLVLWEVVVFVSIVIHEMGHALAYRAFGQDCQVVVYQLGGLAIPVSWGRRGARRPIERLLVAAAGPAAQLAVAAIVVGTLRAAGRSVPFPIEAVGERLGLHEGAPPATLFGFAVALFILQVNVLWPLINLLPVPPLDGGQIVREGLAALAIDGAAGIAAGIGLFVAGAMAWWSWQQGELFMAMMFASLAMSCWQTLQQGRPPWTRAQ